MDTYTHEFSLHQGKIINYIKLESRYIQIKPELEQFIQAQLASGRFASADDVINEAFKLLQEREQRIEKLRQKIAIGTEEVAQGKVTDGEVVFTKLQEKIRQIAEESSE